MFVVFTLPFENILKTASIERFKALGNQIKYKKKRLSYVNYHSEKLVLMISSIFNGFFSKGNFKSSIFYL